jgi:hypothetical protein
MVALIEAARSARLEAQRLRLEERRLRIDMRARQAIQEEMLAAAEDRAGRLQRQRALPSPWSTLQWLREDERLEQTLVPVT